MEIIITKYDHNFIQFLIYKISKATSRKASFVNEKKDKNASKIDQFSVSGWNSVGQKISAVKNNTLLQSKKS